MNTVKQLHKLESEIINSYINNIPTKTICKLYKCSTNTLSKIIRTNNIPFRKLPKLHKNLSKFYTLSLETQYWLGYLCADGNINSKKYIVSITSKDKETINNFCAYFSECVSGIHKTKTNLYTVYICSKQLCNYLINVYNIIPNKSLTLNPNLEITPDFVRGYFDGDGCICSSTKKRKRYECNFTCGSKIFIEKLKEYLIRNGINSHLYKYKNHNVYKLYINKKQDSKNLYKLMYYTNCVCLTRKQQKFVALYGNI